MRISDRYPISIEDLLTDDDFIRFVVAPTRDLTLYWTNQFRSKPGLEKNAAEAAKILNERTSTLTEGEKTDLLRRILEKCG